MNQHSSIMNTTAVTKEYKMSYQDYRLHSNAIKALLETNSTGILQEMFENIFTQYEGLNGVVVIGYTPGFNDGEPCTHHGDICFEVEDYTDMGYEIENDLTEEQYDEICSLIDEELIQRIHDTDYQVIVVREDGEIVIYVEEYDCGY